MDDENPLLMFGAQVTRLRKFRSLSQEALAYKSELARSYLSNVERGKTNVSLVNIFKLASALEVRPIDLFSFPGEVPNQDFALTTQLEAGGIQGV